MRVFLLVCFVALALATAASSSAERNGAQRYMTTLISRTGTYHIGPSGVLPGLRLTFPRAWTITDDTAEEFKIVAPRHPSESVSVWLDVRAVKSSGPGHGATVLRKIGRSPRNLVAWLTSNHDFNIVSKPAARRIGNRIKSTSLAVGVSPTAHYGDPGCPANPRCADLFRNPATWPSGDWFGIGGHNQVRLYLAQIKRHSARHTLVVALAANNHAQLLHLTEAAKTILQSIQLPHGFTNA